jgi:hypothetical protein
VRLLRTLAAAASAALSFACSDADLVGIKPADDRISVEGELCDGPPVDTQLGIKVLFLTDSSNSMRFNDPNDLLVDAMDHIAARYRTTPNIDFAVLRWGSGKVVRENIDYEPVGSDPPLFTNSQARLDAIFARLRQPATVNPDKYLDGTDYELALRAATDYLIADTAKNPGQSLSSRYLIQFVTDGIPQSATASALETRKNIVAATANLHERYGARIDVTSIAMAVVIPPEFIGLLPEMARVGGGGYTQLGTPEGLDNAFDKALANRSQLVEYELASYFVFNRNLRVSSRDGGAAVMLDSDGDGLVDELEAKLGTHPDDPDSDGDKLSDGFEHHFQGEYDPMSFDTSPRGPDGDLDPDGDGLTNFEENRLGTDPLSADSDRDGIPDGVELSFGLDPLAADAQSDADLDGVPAGTEVAENTSPFVAESAEFRAAHRYRVAPLGVPTRSAEGVRCWALKVDNITLGATLAGHDEKGRVTPQGLSTLEIIGIERPLIDDSSPPAAKLLPYRQIRAVRYVVLGPQGQRDPQALVLHVLPSEFVHQ